jgi:hypothetical protein
MKFAVIAPPGWMDCVWRQRLGFHMFLGQELLRNMQYLDWCIECIKRGHHVMVDNGAAEPEEERVPFVEIAKLARAIGADEVILPDKLLDAEYTIGATIKAAHSIAVHARVVVPQGKDWAEWEKCLMTLVDSVPFATIGVAKIYETYEGGRERAMSILFKHSLVGPYKVHWLGIRSAPRREIETALKLGVRSIDSGAPIAWAQNNYPLQYYDEHFSLDWAGMGNENLAEYNIQLALEWSYAHYHRRPAHARKSDSVLRQDVADVSDTDIEL